MIMRLLRQLLAATVVVSVALSTSLFIASMASGITIARALEEIREFMIVELPGSKPLVYEEKKIVPSAPVIAMIMSFGINFVAWIPASILQTEKFYDFTGGISFMTIVTVSAVVGKIRGAAWDYMSSILVIVWALRLSSFLLYRVLTSEHGDRRFDKLKIYPIRFLIPWTLQGMWAFVTSIPAVVQVSAPPPPPGFRNPYDWCWAAGLALWLLGFALEVTADRQKLIFASNPKNKGRFISTGVWSWSRHPNYFGEITLWVGVFVMGIRTYQGTQWVVAISPLFVALLLLKVSGLPMLESYADKKWGEEAAYKEYKRNTHVMVPFLRGGESSAASLKAKTQ